MTYQEFVTSKLKTTIASGFDVKRTEINDMLFDYQKDIVSWSCNMGRNAIFAMTGLGKTFMQCEYSRLVNEHTGSRVLIVAPLAVSKQTIREAKKIGVEVHDLRKDSELHNINIINYEYLSHVNPLDFECIVLDESSILKNYSGKTKNEIVELFRHCRYKLACSATPAPNDFMELGNHSEFLGYMTRSEMLAMYFVHDSGETQTWRLKGHSEEKFWQWVASWAAIITKPSDFGYEDGKHNLPPLNINHEVIHSDSVPEGFLFQIEAKTLNERRDARRASKDDRVNRAAEIVNASDEIFLVWCDLNSESEKLSKIIDSAVEVKGADTNDHKEKSMMDFADGKIKCLVTKPKIAGHGMNWQKCHNMIFVGLSDSFEQYFQAVRRCWRYGQNKPVNVWIITSDMEGEVVRNIEKKEKQAMQMIDGMVKHTVKYVLENIKHNHKRSVESFESIKMKTPKWLRSEA
jgi:hypothetical protein